MKPGVTTVCSGSKTDKTFTPAINHLVPDAMRTITQRIPSLTKLGVSQQPDLRKFPDKLYLLTMYFQTLHWVCSRGLVASMSAKLVDADTGGRWFSIISRF
ncbi:MAG: hypothetical protein CM15mV135_030 [uncultured marine virus]|nr:MAG: hypothetical protein CM15mV135_030 [uncultured marine virus]